MAETIVTEELKAVYSVLDEKKAEDISVLDIEELSTIADYFVIATGMNANHLDALVEAVEETVEDAKEEVDKAVDTVGEIKDSIEEAIESVEDKAEEATITCPVCGVVLPAGTKVCPVCGVELD